MPDIYSQISGSYGEILASEYESDLSSRRYEREVNRIRSRHTQKQRNRQQTLGTVMRGLNVARSWWDSLKENRILTEESEKMVGEGKAFKATSKYGRHTYDRYYEAPGEEDFTFDRDEKNRLVGTMKWPLEELSRSTMYESLLARRYKKAGFIGPTPDGYSLDEISSLGGY